MNFFKQTKERPSSNSPQSTTPTELSGFVCPECMHPLESPEQLLAHFEQTHGSVKQTNQSSVPLEQFLDLNQLDVKNGEERRHLLNELSKHNHTLIQRIVNDNRRIFELESILDFITAGIHLPDNFAFNDKALEARVNSLLEGQAKYVETETELEATTSQLTEVKAELTALKASMNDNVKETRTTTIQTDHDLLEEFSRCREELHSTQREASDLKTQLESSSLEIVRLREQLTRPNVRSQSTAVEVGDLADDAHLPDSAKIGEKSVNGEVSQTTSAELIKLSEQNRQLQLRLSDAESLHGKQIDRLRNELDSLKESLKASASTEQSLVSTVAKLETQLAERQATIDRLSKQLTAFESQREELSTTSRMLSERLEAERESVKLLKTRLSESTKAHQVQLEKRDRQVRDMHSSHVAIQRELHAANTRCEQLRERSQQLADAVERAESQLTEKQMEFDAMLDDSKSQLASARKEADSLLDRLMNTEDKCTMLEQQLCVQTKKLNDLNKALFELGHENQSLQMLRERIMSRQWTRDTDAPNCSSCALEFSLSNRRHHCRNCGGVFCHSCSANRAPTAASKDPVRVCNSCFRELSNR